jgi:mRNA interferase RelE/StbE
MAVIYALQYHPKAISEDIPSLTKTWKEKIRAKIETKLAHAPEIFGKPLRRSLKNYRKLRVGDYRVVFRIEKQTVYIIAILHRLVVFQKIKIRDTIVA